MTISADDGCDIDLIGNTALISNHGSVVSGRRARIRLSGFANIFNNTAQKHESVFQLSESRDVSFLGEIAFTNNTGRQGGAISAYNTRIYIRDKTAFIGNSAIHNGGAISLKEGSTIQLEWGSHVIFEANTAGEYGGAIYVDDDGYRDGNNINCFIEAEYFRTKYHYRVEFCNNSAVSAGSALFGGIIDECITHRINKPPEFLVFNSARSVSSQPYTVLHCINSSTIDENSTKHHFRAIPGQTIAINIVTVGQRFGVAPGLVRAEADSVVIEPLQVIQNTDNKCTILFAGVYKTWPLNMLEYSYLLNLITLPAVVVTMADGPVHIVTQVSVSIALFTSAIVVACKCLIVIVKLLKLDKWIDAMKKNKGTALEYTRDLSQDAVSHALDHQKVTHSVVELTEPLLDYN